MKLFIKNNKIFANSEDSDRTIKALEFYNYYTNSQVELNLQILGYGQLSFFLCLDNDKIKIQFILKSEVGEKRLEELDFTIDYIIYDTFWIPLEQYAMDVIQLIFQELKIDALESINLGTAYELISKANEYDIPFILDESFINFKPKISKEVAYKMHLPLYPYQEFGVRWLTELHHQNIGGLLCDEMGLGKTAQILGLISSVRDKDNSKILIITPASLTINWKREFDKFLPLADSYTHVGVDRTADRNIFLGQRTIITSYDLLIRDKFLFTLQEWDLIICDEAQVLRNKNSQRHKAVLELSSKCKILVTGTPVENSLKDIWALSNIIKPGVLGPFRYFETLIENSPSIARKISKHISPLILRREVKEVMKDLPELIEIEEPLMGTDTFNRFYDKTRKDYLDNNNSKTSTLALLTTLMQICCYPKIIENTYSDPQDTKIVRMLEILSEIKNRKNEKVIIFSTYKKSLDLISQVIKYQLDNPYVEIIDGRLPQEDRFAILDEFQNIEDFAVLCINPSAGGVGLNITSANHVIHFNRQWNPALEKQATARAYRRGQERTVFVYKMYYLGTIEEVINERLLAKEVIAKETLITAVQEGEDKDLQRAISISPIF